MEEAKAAGIEAFLGSLAEELSTQSRLVAQHMTVVQQVQAAGSPIDATITEAKNGLGAVKAAAQIVELLSVSLNSGAGGAAGTGAGAGAGAGGATGRKSVFEELNQDLIGDVIAKLKKYLLALHAATKAGTAPSAGSVTGLTDAGMTDSFTFFSFFFFLIWVVFFFFFFVKFLIFIIIIYYYY